jgi:uncharacterized damage-inducible protein DinB
MPEELSIFPSQGDDWVELARVKSGTLFRKHILNKGVLIHPTTKAKINIDDEFVSTLKRNFDNGVCDIVQVPLADDKNQHSESPSLNQGEVVGVEEENGKVYAIIDARTDEARRSLGKTWLGASAMLSTNYEDTSTGERVGPTLLHVAVTNRPYVTGLEQYQEIIAASNSAEDTSLVVYEAEEVVKEETSEEVQASADRLNDETLEASSPTEENKTMTREELIAALAEHGIDVPALQAAADEAEANAALSNQLANTLAETLELSTNSVDTDTLVGAIAQMHSEKVELSNRVQGLERAQAEHVVNGLINEGYVLPAQKDVYVELRLTNPETFARLIPSEPVVKLSAMVGQESLDDQAKDDLDIDSEITRLTGRVGQ